MAAPPGKVGEIFNHAGLAFSRLGEMTAQIDSNDVSGKWSEEEIEMLRAAVSRFSEEIGNISQRIKLRTLSQTKETMRQKLTNPVPDAGSSSNMPPPAAPPTAPAGHPTPAGPLPASVTTTLVSGVPLSVVNHHPASGGSGHTFPSPAATGTGTATPSTLSKQNMVQRVYLTPASSVLQKNENMTLSALNSPMDSDLDVEAMSAANKIQNMW